MSLQDGILGRLGIRTLSPEDVAPIEPTSERNVPATINPAKWE